MAGNLDQHVEFFSVGTASPEFEPADQQLPDPAENGVGVVCGAGEGVGIEKVEEPEEAAGEIKPPARPAQLKKPKKKAAAAGTTSNPMAEMDLMGSSEED